MGGGGGGGGGGGCCNSGTMLYCMTFSGHIPFNLSENLATVGMHHSI